MLPLKKAQENSSMKKMIKATLSSHHQLKDDEVEPKASKKKKKTTMISPNFLTYMLENEPRTCSKTIFYPKASYKNKQIDSEIVSIMNKSYIETNASFTWK